MTPSEPKQPKEFLVFGAPCIEEPEIEEIVRTMRSGWLGTGPKVAQFERDFWAYKGGWGEPAAVNSCTAALHLSLIAAGIKPGDEVITSALTFCATANAIIHTGATPVLADVNPATMNLEPDDVERRITPRTRALLPVHFAGRPCDMERLMTISRRHGLKVIEDCAHAIETTYRGQHAGTFGDFGCFSFYVTKNIVTGEGGMILARRQEDAARCKILALHGMSRDAWNRFGNRGYSHYQVVECGFKYNMMDLQAAIGLHQLRRISSYRTRRERIWNHYQHSFADIPVQRPADPEPGTSHSYHLYTILMDRELTGISRDEFLDAMTQRGIGVGVHYLALPEHAYYQRMFGWAPEEYPHASRIGRQTVSLPLSPRMTDAQVTDVIDAVKASLQTPARYGSR